MNLLFILINNFHDIFKETCHTLTNLRPAQCAIQLFPQVFPFVPHTGLNILLQTQFRSELIDFDFVSASFLFKPGFLPKAQSSPITEALSSSACTLATNDTCYFNNFMKMQRDLLTWQLCYYISILRPGCCLYRKYYNQEQEVYISKIGWLVKT